LAGDSESDDGDFDSSYGETDFAVIKLKIPELVNKDSAVCSISGFMPVQDTLRDACGYDSVFVKYEPVVIGGPFDNGKKRDTIFAGQSIQISSSGNGTVTWNAHASLSCLTCPDPVAAPATTTVYTAINS